MTRLRAPSLRFTFLIQWTFFSYNWNLTKYACGINGISLIVLSLKSHWSVWRPSCNGTERFHPNGGASNWKVTVYFYCSNNDAFHWILIFFLFKYYIVNYISGNVIYNVIFYLIFFFISERGTENNTANMILLCGRNNKKKDLAWLNVMGWLLFFLFFSCTNLMLFAPSAHILVVGLEFHCR